MGLLIIPVVVLIPASINDKSDRDPVLFLADAERDCYLFDGRTKLAKLEGIELFRE
jgi:hypothetical protein